MIPSSLRKFIRSPLGALILLVIFAFGGVNQAQAATLTVLSLTDTGAGNCELRDAINLINAGGPDAEGCVNSGAGYGTSDTIQFDGALTGTINLTAALPTLLVSVDILAPTLPITIDGGDNFRIFNIDSATDNQVVSISGLTITNGEATVGAGINLETGDTLNLDSSTVSSNDAEGTGTNNGGGILNNGGILNITNSTISGNTAIDNGAGLFVVSGSASLKNTTVSNNDVTLGDGGGIFVAAAGTVDLNNVTIAGDNDATDDGGGIFIAGGATVNLSNTIIADNNAVIGDDDCSGTVNSNDYNLIEDTGGCTINGTTTHNITGVDPDLGALQNNGGATSTHALSASSVAVEAGNPNTPDGVAPNCETTDQRGVTRPQIVFCDIGAYELSDFADLSITKSVDNPAATVGQTVIFTVTVTNNSTSQDSDGVQVTDIVTGPIDVTAVTGGNFTCTNNIGSASGASISNSCTLATLAFGASESFTVTGDVTAIGQIDGIATVQSLSPPDRIASNNSAVASVNGTSACGDGVTLAPEECDDGNPLNGDGCDNNCTTTACGNSIITSGETCDDGNTTALDGCDDNCQLEPNCGDGIVQGPTEQCDDGNTTADDGCNASCQREFCGDGVQQANEECEDSNTDAGDGCSSICKTEFCGDGIVNNDGSEECDDGNLANLDGCDGSCVREFCGDGDQQPALGEECDDGGTVSDDGCSNDCKSELCGDGIVNNDTETCDDGNTTSGDGCDSSCVSEFCGDGDVQTDGVFAEQCDDGDQVSEDGCSALCRTENCGDGIAQSGLSEQCDDGNTTAGDGCNATCQREFCGDNVTQAREECDDGNNDAGDGCSSVCTTEPAAPAPDPRCGDGAVNASIGEECDDGNRVNGDGCDLNCFNEVCGNGIVQSPEEQCDDGNTLNGDNCSSACLIEDESGGCSLSKDVGQGGSKAGLLFLLAGLPLLFTLRRREV